MKGVFVTGTDTGIGKTLVSAWLACHWRADYWKPVQTGTDEDSDAETVARLAPGTVIHPSAYRFKAPLSPDAAARREGATVELEAFRLPSTRNALVVEGAGGVLVPLNGQHLMIDLMARLELPALIVARSTLGTINHTLLTLAVLRSRGIAVAGVVLSGPPNPDNRQAIEHFGKVAVVGEIKSMDAITAGKVAALAPPAFDPPQLGSNP